MHRFTKASICDIEIIRKIAEETWPKTYAGILGAEQLKWMFEWMYSKESLMRQINEGHEFFLLHYKDLPCGYISIYKESGKRFYFQKIYLCPHVQGKGFGKALLDKGIGYIRDIAAPPCLIMLNVNRYNTKAINFYMKYGFRIIDSGDFHIGNGYYMNDYIMAYDII